MMLLGQKDLTCFVGGNQTIVNLKQRFFPTGKIMTDMEATKFTKELIMSSNNNWRTVWYDRMQYCCQGIV